MSNLSHEPHSNAALKSEVERLKVELKEAQAAASVTREALDGCAKHFGEMEDVVWNDDSDVTSETFLESQKSVQAALSTTAGTAFLERMAEAEDLLEGARDAMGEVAAHGSCECDLPNGELCITCECDNKSKAIITWLKGEGVKA